MTMLVAVSVAHFIKPWKHRNVLLSRLAKQINCQQIGNSEAFFC